MQRLRTYLNYLWRLAATGFCFTFFGVVSLLTPLFWVPLLRLLPGGKSRDKERIQGLVGRFFRLFLWTMETLGLMRITTQHAERFVKSDEAFVVIANHPTLIDVVMLLSRMPHLDCIVKQALYDNFFLKGMVQTAGYICNSDDPKALLEACVQNVQAGHSLLIFPEGSRSLPSGLRDFKRGAARIALTAGCRILPITITATPAMLQKEKKWYEIPSQRSKIVISVGEPINPNDVVEPNASPSIAARQLTRFLQDYY